MIIRTKNIIVLDISLYDSILRVGPEARKKKIVIPILSF